MTALIAMVALTALFGWLASRNGSYNRSPLHLAFTFTAFGAILIATGALGFSIRKSGGVPYLRAVDSVIWSQVWLGLGAAALAVLFWWRALKTLRA